MSELIRFKKLSGLNQESTLQIVRNTIKDKNGILWIATGYSGLYKFDGYKLKPVALTQNGSPLKISIMDIDSSGVLWIGTKETGVYNFDTQNETIHHIHKNNSSLKSNYITFLLVDSPRGVWIGSDNGVDFLNGSGKNIHYELVNNDSELTIKSILKVDDKTIFIGTNLGLFSIDTQTDTVKPESLKIKINTLYQDKSNQLYVGTDKGLFIQKPNDSFQNVYFPKIKNKVSTIISDGKNLWVGTFFEGLYKILLSDQTITNYRYSSLNNNSISDNLILSLSLSKSGILWISTFNNGISYFDTNSLNFGLASDSTTSIYCSKNNSNFNFYEDQDSNLWISNEYGLIRYNLKDNLCSLYQSDPKDETTLSGNFVFNVSQYTKNKLWVSTVYGFNMMNIETGKVERITDFMTYFSTNYDSDSVLLGTSKGLFKYFFKSKFLKKIYIKGDHNKNIKVYDFFKNTIGPFSFATNNGVYHLSKEGELYKDIEIQAQMPEVEILSLHITKNKHMWVGTFQKGLFHFDANKQLLRHYDKKGLSKFRTINSIIEDSNNSLWIGSDAGLIKLNTQNDQFHVFHKDDGLQDDFYNRASVYKAPDGKLYFGGRNGFNAFYPEDIKLNTTSPNIVLTGFTRFGKTVEIGTKTDGIVLPISINEMNELILTHKDYVIGFEFAALDFSNPTRNKYAYMMEGLDPDWIYVSAYDRKISYSNLKSGEYTFRVKGSNKDGIWNETGKSLNIIVKPAPWFSWWAYTLYVISVFSLLFWFYNRKDKANQKTTLILRTEVLKQTKKLKEQKLTVEKLLAKKNELFANVSHEFRTPLTLILGPVKSLLNSHLTAKDINSLNMINRNANRLLTMIEQLLQLAMVSNDNLVFYPIKPKTHIFTLVESFKLLAQEKHINIKLIKNDETAISTSKDALEIILGNLLSNAIKYTQIGGEISVSSIVKDNEIYIEVSDSGCGLDKQQQKNIFNRFKRLDSHQNIEGIGIGLSVVEELVKVNNGSIKIQSKIGEGSIFTAVFPTIGTDFEEENENKVSNILINQLTKEVVKSDTTQIYQQSSNCKNKESILIIEDNDDMRSLIIDTLKDYYHCLQADRGKKGIALAIEHVPDIIICDVMMPEMDGFHVTRVLRSDNRTSHIPLMLLTALDDRESRIKGWREHVDVYLTKPFDAQELLLQLENITVIRNILKKKAGLSVKAGKKSRHTDLPKKDQEFINKLNQLVAKKYKDPLYLSQKVASDMAVSERQLQRKLKALIGKKPMDLLREYRLSQATIMLKDGYQVSITCDECGFNSLPHFSKCFKSQFGLSPKAYQTKCK